MKNINDTQTKDMFEEEEKEIIPEKEDKPIYTLVNNVWIDARTMTLEDMK